MANRPKGRFFMSKETYQEVLENLAKHTKHRSECINLIASENVMSPKTREVLSSELGNRYTVGPSERLFPGLDDYTQIEQIAIGMLKTMLTAEYVNVQPLSGMVANEVAYYATINCGDTVLSVSEKYGGHYSHRAGHGEKRPKHYSICLELKSPICPLMKMSITLI